MANIYTTDILTTTPIPTTGLGTGLLSDPTIFPPSNGYKITITANPGERVQAAQMRNIQHEATTGLMPLSYFNDTNSHTEWPSRFQYTMIHLGQVNTSNASGFEEFPAFYKVVFEDSTNPNNDGNWNINASPGNKVYMWVYFGKNETTPISSLANININIDLDYHPDPLLLNDTVNPGTIITTPTINTFTI